MNYLTGRWTLHDGRGNARISRTGRFEVTATFTARGIRGANVEKHRTLLPSLTARLIGRGLERRGWKAA
jgi:hypothetical protein